MCVLQYLQKLTFCSINYNVLCALIKNTMLSLLRLAAAASNVHKLQFQHLYVFAGSIIKSMRYLAPETFANWLWYRNFYCFIILIGNITKQLSVKKCRTQVAVSSISAMAEKQEAKQMKAAFLLKLKSNVILLTSIVKSCSQIKIKGTVVIGFRCFQM